MPLGSSKLGFVKNVQIGVGGAGGGTPITPPVITILASAFSGNTASNVPNNLITNDATTVAFNIDSPFVNTTLNYVLTGDVVAGDFTANTLTGNVTLDAQGNATVSTEITTSGAGHKNFALALTRPLDGLVLANSDTQYIYEVTPITISGGDTTLTSNIVQEDYNSSGPGLDQIFIAHKQHRFTTTGNSTLTVTNLGNHTGNSNVWENQFLTTASVGASQSTPSYWQEGLKIRSLVVGLGGGNGEQGPPRGYYAAGAGEVGVLSYPFANVSPGSYTMEVPSSLLRGNTTVFSGNTTLQRSAGEGQGPQNASGVPFTAAWGSGIGQSLVYIYAGNFIVGKTYSIDQIGTTDFTLIGASSNTRFVQFTATGVGSGTGRATGPAQTQMRISYAPTDLADNVANASFPNNLAEHVEWASACRGGYAWRNSVDGGGGAGGVGGEYTDSEQSYYGVAIDKGTGGGNGGHGISAPNNRGVPLTSGPAIYTALSTWYKNPLLTGENTVFDFAGGTSDSIGDDGLGYRGWGGGTAYASGDPNAVITISYPYRPAYRFVTSLDLS